jgi:hypothetical protein
MSDVQFHIYGVKGDDRVTEMYSNNSEESVDQTVDAMLPNKISFVEGHGGRYTSIELLAVLKVGGWLEILQPANLEDRYHSDDLN